MTLIVGLLENGTVHFESDTLITPRWYPQDFDPASIDLKIQPKVRLFNQGQFAVAVAGDPSPFFQLVRDHHDCNLDFDELRASLLGFHRNSKADGSYETDFLLGSADPVGLFAFKDGEFESIRTEMFIGDEVAYKWLNQKRAEPIGSLTPETRSGRLSHEFQFALNHPDFPGVGGLSIGIRSSDGTFHFKERTFQTASFDDKSIDIFAIDPNSFESLSFVPFDDRKQLRICFPESERCYEFKTREVGSQLPVLVRADS